MTNPPPNKPLYIWNYVFYCIALSFPISAIFGYSYGLYAALSGLLGGIFSGFLILSLAIVAQGFLGKKSVALAGSVIVFKYAIFGIFLYAVITTQSIHNVAFMCGFLSFLPATIAWILKFQKAGLRED